MGFAEFDSYYKSIYRGRWNGLKKALLQERTAYQFDENLKKPYFLDYASVLSAQSLLKPYLSHLDDGDDGALILDACAAPGGKTLVLASGLESLYGMTGHDSTVPKVLANEISPNRRRRLINVLDEYTGSPLRQRIQVSGFNAAAAAGKKSNLSRFAGILLDAPCSSERHVLQSAKYLEQWTPSRPVSLAKRQWALLSAAFLMLRPASPLVYSTCAITRQENDDVVERLLVKYGSNIRICPPDFLQGEPTTYGKIILPDRSEGIGPMYVARFVKL
ncbi:MAG: SAM-dependent methyltransferase [Termitinemataceae bacterium]|nr:MAG: SAM-dependent methyltransferase [Termitinemataceae bacterium]